MEFLGDKDIDKAEDKDILDSRSEAETNLEEPSVELETPEAWPDQQGRSTRETSDKRLGWLQFIGKYKETYI